MKVVIVAKTRMGCKACVGGLVLDTGQNVRLLKRGGSLQPSCTKYEVGGLWDIVFEPWKSIVPPHVEDVVVQRMTFLDHQPNLRAFLLHQVHPWNGAAEILFDGLLHFSSQGHGYISRTGKMPGMSVGFWIPDRNLSKTEDGTTTRYEYLGEQRRISLPYIGFAPSVDVLPAGSLLRVSLARWMRTVNTPRLEERCYLQLSGWYDVGVPASPPLSDR